jgi:hypothetical protein
MNNNGFMVLTICILVSIERGRRLNFNARLLLIRNM